MQTNLTTQLQSLKWQAIQVIKERTNNDAFFKIPEEVHNYGKEKNERASLWKRLRTEIYFTSVWTECANCSDRNFVPLEDIPLEQLVEIADYIQTVEPIIIERK
jgi:hypothetical protein